MTYGGRPEECPSRVRRAGCRIAATVAVYLLGASPTPALTLSLPSDAGAPSGSSTEVPLLVDDASGMLGTDIVITYDPSVALATGVSKTALSSGQTLTFNLSPLGSIRISLFGVAPLSGGGVLVNLSFTSTGATNSRTLLDLVSASVNEGALPVTLQDGRYCVQGRPDEVRNLFLGHATAGSTVAVFHWDASPYATAYNIYRASDPRLGDIACFIPGVSGPPASDDGSTPALGGAFFYLLSSSNCRAESTLGFDSSGAERATPAPCP